MSKNDSSSNVTIGNVSGNIHRNKIAGRDIFEFSENEDETGDSEGQTSTQVEYFTSQEKYPKYLVPIAQLMHNSFNLVELKDICFKLTVDYDNLQGRILSEQIQELLLFLNRHDRIPELLELVQQLRPNIAWDRVYPGLSE